MLSYTNSMKNWFEEKQLWYKITWNFILNFKNSFYKKHLKISGKSKHFEESIKTSSKCIYKGREIGGKNTTIPIGSFKSRSHALESKNHKNSKPKN